MKTLTYIVGNLEKLQKSMKNTKFAYIHTHPSPKIYINPEKNHHVGVCTSLRYLPWIQWKTHKRQGRKGGGPQGVILQVLPESTPSW